MDIVTQIKNSSRRNIKTKSGVGISGCIGFGGGFMGIAGT
jgi:hypothetical protein